MKFRFFVFGLIAAFVATSFSFAGDDSREKAAAALKALGLSGLPGMPGAAASGETPVKAIGWRDLAKLLPKTLDGMEAGKIKGGTFSMGGLTGAGMPDSIKKALSMAGLANSYSTAERTYSQDLGDGKTKRMTIRVMDAGMVKAMLSPFLMAVEYDTPDGIMKSIKIAGHPARIMQKYNDDLEVTETQYMVLIGDRVMAQFEGNEFVEEALVTAQAKNFPYAKLESLAHVPGKVLDLK